MGRELLLISLDNAVLAAAGLRTTDLRYRAGNTVYERGSPAQFIYVVNTGALCRFRPLHGGRRSILQFLFAGDGFGYEPGAYHRETVHALTDSKVFAAGSNGLEAALGSPRSNVLFAAAARAFFLAEDQTVILRQRTATERTALFLLEMQTRLSTSGQIDLPMNRQDISDYLGLRMETTSRAMNEFCRAKIIQIPEHKPKRIIIRDKARLEQLASDASDFEWWNYRKHGASA